MEERELAKYFDERRGDVSLWADRPAKAQVRKGSTVVFSVRFAREDLELVQERAQAEGLTVSEFIRRSALRAAESGTSSSTAVRVLECVSPGPDFFAVYRPTVGVVGELKKSGELTQEDRPVTASSSAA